MKRWMLIPACLLALGGCDRPVSTDGSPEAGRVAQWLSSSRWRDGSGEDPVARGGRLTLSDYGEPLTLANLRRSGPDRIKGCRLARVERSRFGVTATWSCDSPVPPAQRRVEFRMTGTRIDGAGYQEAVQFSQ
jgi:hypothetical protein